jgi:hypothetical protein
MLIQTDTTGKVCAVDTLQCVSSILAYLQETADQVGPRAMSEEASDGLRLLLLESGYAVRAAIGALEGKELDAPECYGRLQHVQRQPAERVPLAAGAGQAAPAPAQGQ